jgi:hypothetical protein
VDGAPASVHTPGDDGIDNSFGANVMPIFLGLSSTFSQGVNQSITTGRYTILLSMVSLGLGPIENPLLTRLYEGANLGSAPLFDGNDPWPVLSSSLANPTDITSATVQFPSSYVNQDTWVSGTKATVVVTLALTGFNLDLYIHDAQIAFDLDPTHRHGTNGTISGVIDPQTLINELEQLSASLAPDFCDPGGPGIEGVVVQIQQASDILSDGTQDPTKPCDGISIGLGFNAELVQLGAIVPPPPPPPNPCADGG